MKKRFLLSAILFDTPKQNDEKIVIEERGKKDVLKNLWTAIRIGEILDFFFSKKPKPVSGCTRSIDSDKIIPKTVAPERPEGFVC